MRQEAQWQAVEDRYRALFESIGDGLCLMQLLFDEDITERKQAEARLQESETRFRNMADHAPVMLWVTDAQARCTYLNQRWYDFTGQNEETGLGMGWLQAVHPDDAKRSGDIFLAANARKESFRLEYRLRRQDGEYRWAIDAASPRFGPDGAFLGYIGSVIDITDRKRVEEEREVLLSREQEARAQAEEANRLKDEFLATVSHELRTPLSAMLGWVQLLRAGTLPMEKRERALETIERNARAQAQLIEDLLDVSRILSGKLKLEVEPVSVGSVVEQALDAVRPAAEARNLRLQAALDSTSSVMGDAMRLQQVVWNLLSNAVKFTPKGGRVQVFVERREASVPPSLQAEALKADLRCPPELNGLRVLVVDDEADTRELLRTLFEGCRARVRAASSAAEGLRALREELPDILVSDIGMPEEDGYAFIRKVRSLPSAAPGRLPAVALTAYARVEDRTRVLLAGYQSHVPKPVEPIELLAVLASLSYRHKAGH